MQEVLAVTHSSDTCLRGASGEGRSRNSPSDQSQGTERVTTRIEQRDSKGPTAGGLKGGNGFFFTFSLRTKRRRSWQGARSGKVERFF